MCAVVEQFIKPPARTGRPPFRRDLFSFADILAVVPEQPGCLAIQACRTADQSTRIEKITSEKVWPKALRWLTAGNGLCVHGWAIRGAYQARKLWTLSITEISYDAKGRPMAMRKDT